MKTKLYLIPTPQIHKSLYTVWTTRTLFKIRATPQNKVSIYMDTLYELLQQIYFYCHLQI